MMKWRANRLSNSLNDYLTNTRRLYEHIIKKNAFVEFTSQKLIMLIFSSIV